MPANPVVPAARVALAVLENPAVPAVQVELAVLESPAARAVQVALAVLENLAVPAVRVALAVLENRVALVALAVPENPAVRAALARQVVAVLPRQVEAVEKEAQTRSVAISRPVAAVAVAPLLAGVGALLKPRAIGVAAA